MNSVATSDEVEAVPPDPQAKPSRELRVMLNEYELRALLRGGKPGETRSQTLRRVLRYQLNTDDLGIFDVMDINRKQLAARQAQARRKREG